MPENKLKNEKSPYLLQHKDNPVFWFPWSDEAFEIAKQQGKPVFLSIGYSTCHWCHVMAHESFEDNEIAALMNDTFINIKVDREERPDIDGIYMTVCQLLTGIGGWPLTVIMTSEKKPFFAGTYFPKDSIYGRIGMRELITKVKQLWQNQREDTLDSAEHLTNQLKYYTNAKRNSVDLTTDVFTIASDSLERNFDSTFGGFSLAPKFPIPHNLTFLLRYWKENNEEYALEMLDKTLVSMRLGGIYDHIGYGIHRYSTDRRWVLPHFEKMLYDQAQLITAYTEAYVATKNQLYKSTAQEIIEYVLRDMTDEQGGFYSAEDADSEGKEGKFYIWKSEELDDLLGIDAPFFKDVYNVSEKGNFKDERGEMHPNSNILHRIKSDEEIAKQSDLSIQEFHVKLLRCNDIVFKAREKRIHPYKDDKILTNWNAMMIGAFATCSAIFSEHSYYNSAVKAADFILSKMFFNDTELIHRYRDGDASISGQLDDYVYLALALLDLFEAGFEVNYLKKAIKLMDLAIEYFWDEEQAGFFASHKNSKDLIIRQKEIYDGAIPSGNSIALLVLNRLFLITGNQKYKKYSNELVSEFSAEILPRPANYTQFLNGLYYQFGKSYEIIITCKTENDVYKSMLEMIYKSFIPSKSIIKLSPSTVEQGILELCTYLADYDYNSDQPKVYVCSEFKCLQPVESAKELARILNEIHIA